MEFTEEELFLKIAGLSYQGDFRMSLGGENPKKVFNIVSKQYDEFKEIYQPIIENIPAVSYKNQSILVQDENIKVRALMLQKLPKGIQFRIVIISESKIHSPIIIDGTSAKQINTHKIRKSRIGLNLLLILQN
jgi:hypothetical protein